MLRSPGVNDNSNFIKIFPKIFQYLPFRLPAISSIVPSQTISSRPSLFHSFRIQSHFLLAHWISCYHSSYPFSKSGYALQCEGVKNGNHSEKVWRISSHHVLPFIFFVLTSPTINSKASNFIYVLLKYYLTD